MTTQYDKRIQRNPLVKQLTKEIEKLGYKLIFVPSYRALGVHDALGMHVKSPTERSIYITRRTPEGKLRPVADIAFIMAHELRHALHIRDRLYVAYYERDKIKTLAQYGASVAVGRRAELDCDRYARARLREAGTYSKFSHRTYPLRKVSGYLTYRQIQLYKRFMNGGLSKSVYREFEKITQLIARDEL